MTKDKECFVICPIGSEGSDIRERADKLLEHIIEESVSELGYYTTRADEITEPGSITNQVIDKTLKSDLVIADLTGHNPNVFYELAVRHATGKPYIQLIDSTEDIPFDISAIRTIYYDFDIESATQTINNIQSHINAIEEEESDFPTPISQAVDVKSWEESEDPIRQNLADMMDSINQMNNRLGKIEKEVNKESGYRPTKITSRLVSETNDSNDSFRVAKGIPSDIDEAATGTKEDLKGARKDSNTSK